MVRNQKPKQMEQKPKSSNGVRCMECGNARGTMCKIKKSMEQKVIYANTVLMPIKKMNTNI